MDYYAAIDLGASSGRVSIASLTSGKLEVSEVHRFKHDAEMCSDGTLRWQWQKILDEVKKGLLIAKSHGNIISVGVDSWACDYGLLDGNGVLIETPYCYRDARTDGVMESVSNQLGRDYIYEKTGIQFLFFNTIFQFAAASNTPSFKSAVTFLMLPDLLNHHFCGSLSNEISNASTTQLINAHTRGWDWALIDQLGLPRNIFPPLHETGAVLGEITGHGELDGIKVVAVASHDTGSAVAGIPLNTEGTSAYISSGTWSLIGLELKNPITNTEAMSFNITNELGAEHTVRFLRNVTGMWLLEESVRYWRAQGNEISLSSLIDEAAALPGGGPIIEANDSHFSKPGPMPELITVACLDRGQKVPSTPAEIARCIFDSLALAYSKVLEQLERASGITIEEINIVGGGSNNVLLNQLTANATQRLVISGPVEATVLGNLIVQMITSGEISSIIEGRQIIARSVERRTFTPA